MVYTRTPRRHALETTAKLFQNGRSQAVRLPKEFRFKGDEVRIRKEEDRVILEPLEQADWPEGFWELFGPDARFDVAPPLATAPVDPDGGENGSAG